MLQSVTISSITELDIDNGSAADLCQIGLPEALPCVQKITLTCEGPVEQDIIKTVCSSFVHLTEFLLRCNYKLKSAMCEHAPLCEAMMTTCSQLVTLSISDLELGNKVASGILHGLRDHKSLESIT